MSCEYAGQSGSLGSGDSPQLTHMSVNGGFWQAEVEVKVEQRSDFPHLSLSHNFPLRLVDCFSILLDEVENEKRRNCFYRSINRQLSFRMLRYLDATMKLGRSD